MKIVNEAYLSEILTTDILKILNEKRKEVR
jgi:hypothetical protein